MKITRIEIRKLALPMTRSFKASFGVVTHKETVITKLYTSDGLVGFGESSSLWAPVYNHETNDTCMYIQEKFIAPRIIGKNFETPQEFREAYADVIGNPTAKTGPECAFWDLVSQRDNKSLKRLVGGVKDEIPVGESIGMKPSIKQTLDEIDKRIAEGYLRIKLKIEPGWDVELVRRVRERYPDVTLTVDANSAYNLREHGKILRSLEQFEVSIIEQPFGECDLVDHAAFQSETTIPICLDESIESADDARSAAALGSCKVINIKPGRVGGLVESVKIHDLAAEQGIGVFCGGMMETGIGRAFNIALASKQNFSYPSDMSPASLYFSEDVVESSFTVKPNGHVDVPDRPGLGFTVKEDIIAKFTKKKVVVE